MGSVNKENRDRLMEYEWLAVTAFCTALRDEGFGPDEIAEYMPAAMKGLGALIVEHCFPVVGMPMLLMSIGQAMRLGEVHAARVGSFMKAKEVQA